MVIIMAHPEIIEHPPFPLVDLLDGNIPAVKSILYRPLELDQRHNLVVKHSTLYEIGNRTLLTVANQNLQGLDMAAFSYGLKVFEVIAGTIEPKLSIEEHDSANATRPISSVHDNLTYDFDGTLDHIREEFQEAMPKLAGLIGQNALLWYGDSAKYMTGSAGVMRHLEVSARTRAAELQGRPIIEPPSKLQ
jgi:hypothetical protein